MKLKNRFLIGIGILLGVLVVAIVAGSFFFFNLAIKRSNKDFLQESMNDEGKMDTLDEAEQVEYPGGDDYTWLEEQDLKIWEIQSEDGLTLKGYYLESSNPTNKVIMVAHGYSSKAKDMASFARLYAEQLGYNVFMPDARAHGGSEGDFIGFGWLERKDYLLWIDKIIQEVGTDVQIGAYGISMGGATVMMLSGEALPEQVKVIIEDCGYSSVEKQLSYQLNRLYHLPSFPLLYTTSILTKIQAGYDFSEASAVEQVKHASVPILFIHGGSDSFVPTEMVYEVYNACSTEKELLIVDGAEHGCSFITDPEEYTNIVSDFLKNAFRN